MYGFHFSNTAIAVSHDTSGFEENAGLKSDSSMKSSLRGKRLPKPPHVDMETRSKKLKSIVAINTPIGEVQVFGKGSEKLVASDRGLRNRGRTCRSKALGK
jgi:hypothetical protein